MMKYWTYIGDLFYFDCVSYLSVYINEEKVYIQSWLNTVEGVDIFALYRVDKNSLEAYMSSQITYLELIESALHGKYLVNSKIVVFEELDSNCLPVPTAFYDKDLGESDHEYIKKQLNFN